MASSSAKGASRRERHGFVEVIYDPLAVERDPHAPLIVFNPDELPTNAGSPCPDEANDGGDVRDVRELVGDGELDSDDEDDDDSVGSLVDFIAPDDAIEDEEDEDGATGESDVCTTEDDDDDEDGEDEDEEDDDEAEPPASKPTKVTVESVPPPSPTATSTDAHCELAGNTRRNGVVSLEDEGLDTCNIISGRRCRRPVRRYVDGNYAALMLEDVPDDQLDAIFEDDDHHDSVSGKRPHTDSTGDVDSSEEDYLDPKTVDVPLRRAAKRRARRHFL